MTIAIINAGATIGESDEGWTNTYETALVSANAWLEQMTTQGFRDIVMTPDPVEREGRWRFTFRHTVTGVSVELETHGIDNLDAYRKKRIFDPKIYWRGSSCANPSIKDFAADGFEPVVTYRAVTS